MPILKSMVDAMNRRLSRHRSSLTETSTSLLYKIRMTAMYHCSWSQERFETPTLFRCNLFPDLPSSQAKKALSRTFVDNLPEDARQKHTCRACFEFIDNYGDLCFVDEKSGSLTPFLWPKKREVPARYQQAVGAIRSLFEGKRAMKPYEIYLEAHLFLGIQDKRGPDGHIISSRHLNATLLSNYFPVHHAGRHELRKKFRKRAHIDCDLAHAMLQQALNDHSFETIREAFCFTNSNGPFHGPALWLLDFAELYYAVGPNPDAQWNMVRHHSTFGYTCLAAISNGPIGELLGLIGQGMVEADIQAKWKVINEVHNRRFKLKWTRKGLGRLEERLRLIGYTKTDLDRYVVTTEDLPDASILWKNDDVFRRDGFVRAKAGLEPGTGAPPTSTSADNQTILCTLRLEDAPATPISFQSFVRRVLTKAEAMELFLPGEDEKFKATIFTCGDPEAKSPFVFDSADKKNTMAWYTQDEAQENNLKPGWNVVTGIVTYPHMWDYLSPKEAIKYERGDSSDWPHERHGIRFLFCLRSIECATVNRGLCNVPGSLKPALETGPVRKLVKIMDEKGGILGYPEHSSSAGKGAPAYVGGVEVRKEGFEKVLLRVRNKHGFISQYQIVLFD
jgi:hypothetical protein